MNKTMPSLTLQIGLLTALLSLLPPQLHAQQSPDPAQQSESQASDTSDTQTWYGVLDAEVRKFRFVVKLEKTNGEDGWTGTLLSLDEGSSKFPLSNLEFDGQALAFDIQVSAGRYTGRLDEATGKIVGQWKQRQAELDLAFEKVDAIPKENLKALWVGELKVLFQRLEIAFRELENGEILFDSRSQKAGGFVASKSVDNGQITFEVPSLKAKFTGEMNDDGSEIIGKFEQGLFPLDLTLKRSEVDEPAPEPAASGTGRPQTPQEPFPYESIQVNIPNPQDRQVTLAGTLTLPRGTERVPAVILISGSGPQDRDESIAGHKPFWVLADHLSRHGIAVLRFDDRGIQKSRGDFNSATSVDFASDVTAIFNFLTEHERIDPLRVGLCGHSEGGIIAPMVAVDNPQVAFVVMMAGTGVPGEAILKSQLQLILEASGVAAEEVQRQRDMQNVYLDLATRTPPTSKEEFKVEARERIQPLLTPAEIESDTLTTLVDAAIAQVTTPWVRYFLIHDPSENLSKVTCPVLAINGSKDLQVDAELNIPAIEAALAKSQSKNYETIVFPNLNHLFQQCKTGNIDEYETIDETIAPAVLEKITQWILDVTR